MPSKRKVKVSAGQFYLTAIYRVPGQFGLDQNIDHRLEKAIGEAGGSGSGFGERDLGWYHLSEKQADAKAKKLKALKIKGLKVKIHPES